MRSKRGACLLVFILVTSHAFGAPSYSEQELKDFFEALGTGSFCRVTAMLEAHPDLAQASYQGNYPFHVARLQEIIHLLVRYNSPLEEENDFWQTPLRMMVFAEETGAIFQLIDALLLRSRSLFGLHSNHFLERISQIRFLLLRALENRGGAQDLVAETAEHILRSLDIWQQNAENRNYVEPRRQTSRSQAWVNTVNQGFLDPCRTTEDNYPDIQGDDLLYFDRSPSERVESPEVEDNSDPPCNRTEQPLNQTAIEADFTTALTENNLAIHLMSQPKPQRW